jgi:C_GCAxxG_C_C family probable redox protein
MSDLTFVRAFTNRLEAEQAQAYLQDQGIAAMVMADDGGGMYAGLSLGRKGVRLLVRAEDADRAREALEPGVILDPMEATSPGAGSESVPAPLVAAEAATRYFDAGNNCAEAVLRAFAADSGLEDQVVRLVTGFGGGMGRAGAACGALSGAVMAVGLHRGRLDPDDAGAKERCYDVVADLRRQFQAACGATDCRDLTGVDLATDEGRQEAEDRDLHATVCRNCVWEAARIAAALLAGPSST